MKKASKYVPPTIIVLVLVLDFLALDDITTGNEPNYQGEWDFLLFSLIFFAIMIYVNWESVKKWTTKRFSRT